MMRPPPDLYDAYSAVAGFAVGRFVIVAATGPVVGLAFDLSCSSDFSAAGAVVDSDAASVSQSSS